MKLTKEQRAELKQKYDGRCAYCGIELGSRWHADHLEPVEREVIWYKCNKTNHLKSKSGAMKNPELDVWENLMPSCTKCNNDKSSMRLNSWRRVIQDRIKTLNESPKYASYQKAKRYGLVVETGCDVVFYFERYDKEKNPAANKNIRKAKSLNTTVKSSQSKYYNILYSRPR